MHKYTCQVTLIVLGPFLTAAANPHAYGLDKSFHRDYLGRLVVPASHIKGKLRMSLEEISTFIETSQPISLSSLFGTPSGDHQYEANAGQLKFSDFVIEHGFSQSHGEQTEGDHTWAGERTRTAIDPTSGTAAEHQLRSFEDRFPSNTEISCKGQVSFYARDRTEAQATANFIRMGFIWLSNLGSEKGVGFGRLHAVHINPPEPQNRTIMEVSLQNGEAFHLRIIAQEPIAVGGIQKRRTNFAETEKIIPGGAIKGALTASLNRAHGFPATKMLSKKDAGAYQGFEKLVEYFSLIRITHAFPALTGKPRAVRKPLSAVRIIDNQELDVALSSQAFPIQGECAPTYFIDWKEPKQEYFGAAVPEEILMTHTEIDDQSRRSLAGNLFTESYLCPIDSDGRTVEWICNVDFWSIEDPNERKQAALQFSKAIQLYLDGLGRESRQVELSVLEGYAIPAMESKDWNQGDLVLLTLQSDALMLDPQAVRTLEPWQDLYDLYAKFWEEISGQSKSTPCMKLVDFFAHQSFKGGYLYHRYLGAAERKQKPNQYRPYYLTKAGSLFKLQITDTQKARECLTRWAQRGLDLPEWAKQEYGQYERALWQNCPFVRENGYGEVAINLVWHWDHALERSS